MITNNQPIVLSAKKVYKSFGNKEVLYDVNLEVARGQTVSIVGPSGCGKSTFLKMVLGTIEPTRGTVSCIGNRGNLVNILKPARDRGIVYQNYSLYPHLTALQNVAIGLKFKETTTPQRFLPKYWFQTRKDHIRWATEWLEKMGLHQALHLYPQEMSGGMRQRVAIAQALIMEPTILLLDEPFGALDEATREELQKMLLGLYDENVQAINNGEDAKYTILMVTHELHEAFYVADRVVGLSQFWDWREELGQDVDNGPATIIYDKVAPVYRPNDLADKMAFDSLIKEIREIVFDPKVLHDRHKNITFWTSVKNGEGNRIFLKKEENG